MLEALGDGLVEIGPQGAHGTGPAQHAAEGPRQIGLRDVNCVRFKRMLVVRREQWTWQRCAERGGWLRVNAPRAAKAMGAAAVSAERKGRGGLWCMLIAVRLWRRKLQQDCVRGEG